MLTPPSDSSDFAARWNAYVERTESQGKWPLVQFAIENTEISERTTRFLNEIGLPDSANFNFEFKSHEAGKRVFEVYGTHDNPSIWNQSDRERLKPYLLLGANQGGDPVCLDLTQQEAVVMLYHENDFKPGEIINSSVVALAECILIFQEMIEEFQRDSDEELYEGYVPPELVKRTLEKMGQIDKKAVAKNAYWPGAMNYI